MSIETVEQPSPAPTHKIGAVGAASALTTLIIFIAALFDFGISQEVAAAIVTVIGFVAGYFKRESVANVTRARVADERGAVEPLSLLVYVIVVVILIVVLFAVLDRL